MCNEFIMKLKLPEIHVYVMYGWMVGWLVMVVNDFVSLLQVTGGKRRDRQGPGS